MHDISTADSGSRYPHTATVFTGSADIEEKYNKQPRPVFINPRNMRGKTLPCGILINRGIIRIGTFSSVAAHWLPNIIRAFRKDYPEIEYELLLGDYSETETWIEKGRADFGFLRLPSEGDFESIFLEDDRLCAVIPKNHRLAKSEVFPIEELCSEPFMLLDKDNNTDISALFEKYSLKPDIKFTTWDDYAIMSMVECGLGISVLPELILRRIPYDICVKPLSVPAYRKIGVAFKSKKALSAAAKEFLKYLDFRNG